MTKHFIILLSVFFIGCGPSLVSTGAKTVIKENEDEKTFSESWDDATIKLGIKEKYFSYDATLFTLGNKMALLKFLMKFQLIRDMDLTI